MEVNKKCSNKKHSELNAVSYCADCNLYLCNKCVNIHLEYLASHNIINLDKNNKEEILTGICKEDNHKIKLEYYCKNHNELCCAACLCRIKKNGNGKHHDCDVCEIKEIKEEKKNKLNENIKYLEELSKNIEEKIKQLREIYKKINETKEELKLKISRIFTKIRSILNEREDQLLLELDQKFNDLYYKENIIKKVEKMPNNIKTLIDKGKLLLNKEWNDEKKLIERINDCKYIEENINNIIEINKNIEKKEIEKINIKFMPENEQNIELIKNIKKFGEIYNEADEKLKFKFKPGKNYIITNNDLVATKNNGGDNYNCVIVGNKELPKDRISKWKIKINKINKSYDRDIYIGIGPNSFKGDLYDECWSICRSRSSSKIKLLMKNNISDYNNHKEDFKEGDIIEVIVDRKNGNLSFAINDVNYGIACSDIPKNDILFPTIVLYEQGNSVEIVD